MKLHGRKEFPRDEELVLLRAAQSGDRESQNLVLSTTYFSIINIAAKIAGPSTPPDAFDDILSAGIEGAITAIHRHNLTANARLRTFANAYIRGMTMREVSKSYSPLSVPHNSVTEARALTNGATAEDLGITDAKAFSLRAASLGSIDFADVEVEQHPIRLDDEFAVLLQASLEQLDPDAHFTVCHTYGILGFAQLPKTEIARTYGIPTRSVQTILDNAVELLQDILT